MNDNFEGPIGKITRSNAAIAFFSSGSGNTARLCEKLSHETVRIQARKSEGSLIMGSPYVLITPSYADAYGQGAIPAPVLRFLEIEENHHLLRGVIGTGNRNFGDMFALGGRRVSEKFNVPLLYRCELAGTLQDQTAINNGISRFLSIPVAA